MVKERSSRVTVKRIVPVTRDFFLTFIPFVYPLVSNKFFNSILPNIKIY